MKTNKHMKYLTIVIPFLTFCNSCTKKHIAPTQPAEPAMLYFNLNNKVLKPHQNSVNVDVNADGRKDLFFSVWLIGDPIAQQDKWAYVVSSDLYTLLPINEQEEVPVMNSYTLIPKNSFSGYDWWGASAVMLVQKVISIDSPDYWEGHWLQATKKYLPFQVVVNTKPYAGWIELSVDTANEQIILHRGAVCAQPNITIKAGS